MVRMRWAVVAIGLASACGSDHYGTYFLADGRGAKISFDHAELYFGDHVGTAFASPAGPQTGDVYQRLFNPADVAVPADHSTELATYYLAPDGDTNVGSYVLAVARDAQNAIVGVGEATQFPLAADHEVLEVSIPLEAPNQNVHEWGAAPTCLSWTRPKDQPVAFVRDDDRDCDGATADADCNDLLYCGAGDPTCSTTPLLCDVPCAIGCLDNGICAPSACVFAEACNGAQPCAARPTLADVLTCFSNSATPTHLDIRLPTGPQNGHQNQPCVRSFSLPLTTGMRCTNPTIVYAEPFSDGYVFDVQDGGSACKFTMNTPPNSPAFVGDHHLLVAIDPPTGIGPRSTFFMGVNPLSGAMCTSVVSTTNPLMITSCP
jgi:hypothetical protein